jgi:hypothetical protein
MNFSVDLTDPFISVWDVEEWQNPGSGADPTITILYVDDEER